MKTLEDYSSEISESKFTDLVSELMSKQGLSEDSARRIAAFIGRKKFGKKGFEALRAKASVRKHGAIFNENISITNLFTDQQTFLATKRKL